MLAISVFAILGIAVARLAFGNAPTSDSLASARDEHLQDIGLARRDLPTSDIVRINAQIDRSRLNAWV